MNYNECEEYLCQLNTKGMKPGLDAIKTLLSKLGDPQDDLCVIHVAGTNGKGSTASFIASVLKEAGFKVGVYSSPAVFEEREIIRIGKRNISKEDYVNLINEIKDTGLEFTRFELETAMALLYFKRKECDYAIIECGMGGRDDATNVFKTNVLSVFAAIGMDHMAYLGDTVNKIATNKAGIIKPGGRCVVNGTSKDALDAIKTVAEEKKNPLYVYDPDELKKVKLSLTGASFDYKELKNVKISLLGTYQPDNAATAIEACFALKDAGVKISDKNIYNGLHNTTEPGRFEIISKKPLTVIDGAHNEPASQRLRESIQKYFPDRKLIFIIGVLKDKEYDKVIENTCDLCEHVITVTAHNKTRALSALDLALSVKKVNPTVTTADSVDEAVELAYMLSDKDSAVIAFGSLSYLFQVKKAVDKYKDKVKEWHRQHDR